MLAGEGEGHWDRAFMKTIDREERARLVTQLRDAIQP
jgi:hypothetical protein